jgi:hypothetical protein
VIRREETVLVIPDLQIPFEHKDALRFVMAVRDAYGPTVVVNIGDEVDFHALSDFDADPDGFSAGDEMGQALKHLDAWYEEFQDVKVCISNHTARPFRRAYKYGIPRHFLKDYQEFLEAPDGWSWEEYYILDEVRYEHGHALGGGYGKTAAANAPLKNGRSTVFGHFHASAGIQYTATPEALLFGFNVGSLIDFKTYAFKYSHGAKSRPILGCGIIDRGVPTFIPMLLKPNGRWIGELIG